MTFIFSAQFRSLFRTTRKILALALLLSACAALGARAQETPETFFVQNLAFPDGRKAVTVAPQGWVTLSHAELVSPDGKRVILQTGSAAGLSACQWARLKAQFVDFPSDKTLDVNTHERRPEWIRPRGAADACLAFVVSGRAGAVVMRSVFTRGDTAYSLTTERLAWDKDIDAEGFKRLEYSMNLFSNYFYFEDTAGYRDLHATGARGNPITTSATAADSGAPATNPELASAVPESNPAQNSPAADPESVPAIAGPAGIPDPQPAGPATDTMAVAPPVQNPEPALPPATDTLIMPEPIQATSTQPAPEPVEDSLATQNPEPSTETAPAPDTAVAAESVPEPQQQTQQPAPEPVTQPSRPLPNPSDFDTNSGASSYPKDADLERAKRLVRKGRYDEAEAIFKGLMAKVPYDSRTGLGDIAAARGRYQDAIQQFQSAIFLNPKAPDAYNGLGKVSFNRGNYEQAAVYFKQALDYDEKSAVAMTNLGWVALAGGDVAGAQEWYEKALAAGADDASRTGLYTGLAQVALARGAPSQALMYAGEILRTDPESAVAQAALSQANLMLNDPELALKAARRAIELAPDQHEFYYLAAEAAAAGAKYDEAVSFFEQAIARAPQNAPQAPIYYLGLARVQAARGDRPAARATLEKARAAFPDNAAVSAALNELDAQ